MLKPIREDRNHHCKDEGAGPRRDGVQLCLDWVVAKLLDDCGREVGIAFI